VLATALLVACEAREGPQPIVYDREACAHCRMLISDPSFAAQLVTEEGEVRSFDDPGCLLAHLAEKTPDVRALWFHHVREERWIPGDRVAFERVVKTPMGYGLGAVDAGPATALDLDEARALVAAHEGRPAVAP
jgi:copper chaperone NosL